jgi:hypothetical protein
VSPAIGRAQPSRQTGRSPRALRRLWWYAPYPTLPALLLDDEKNLCFFVLDFFYYIPSLRNLSMEWRDEPRRWSFFYAGLLLC